MSQVEYLGDSRNLFLDVSSTCTGWVVANMDSRTKEVTIQKAGVIWFGDDTPHGKRYRMLCEFVLDIAYIMFHIQNIIAEGYMVNIKRVMGTLVIPEAQGAIKAACFETIPPLGFYNMFPQSWRSVLGIKKDTNFAGTKAWKEPTKTRVEQLLGQKLPEKIVSNVTGKERPMPYDMFDALAISIAWHFKEPNSCTKIKVAANFLT